jgi:DNA polymerase (family 10)
MATDNYFIADQFTLLSKLMDIHNENSFKTKSYSIAAFTIEKLPEQLSVLSPAKILTIKGIGDAIGKKIMQILETGELPLLKEYIGKTPAGVIEMLNIKGLGPKKISTVWKEMEIESIGELLYACNENRLLLYKGFGEKSQENIRKTIEFYLKSMGSFLYSEAEQYALSFDEKLKSNIPGEKFELTGEFRRQMEVINQLEWVTTSSPSKIQSFLEQVGRFNAYPESGKTLFKAEENPTLCFHHSDESNFHRTLFDTSGSEEFLEAWKTSFHGNDRNDLLPVDSESDIFSSQNIHFIPAALRENPSIIEKAKQKPLPLLIEKEDIKGIVHSHSNWSDGSYTIEAMALACIERGFEYLVISDHSKSAFYANGLSEERIKEQHHYIEELNQKLFPFRIFKSIESDILGDGNLDYSDDILSTFDLVISSVHSNLKMNEEKAMARLLKAIENPYTVILGHMTGRLLLSRPGYPLDHKKIIEACAANQVVIELNAHPRRLDIDWRWADYALEKEVLLSIDPDAHSIEGYGDTRFGILAAQKAGLTKERNLSSFGLKQFEEFLYSRKKNRGVRF